MAQRRRLWPAAHWVLGVRRELDLVLLLGQVLLHHRYRARPAGGSREQRRAFRMRFLSPSEPPGLPEKPATMVTVPEEGMRRRSAWLFASEKNTSPEAAAAIPYG